MDQNDQEQMEFLPEDFTPPIDLLQRMKISWPEFVELFGDTPYETQGELLTVLAEAAGITRPEAAYLLIGLYDGQSARTGLNWIDS
jgi:hypothetical protein